MSIYDPIASALGLTPIDYTFNYSEVDVIPFSTGQKLHPDIKKAIGEGVKRSWTKERRDRQRQQFDPNIGKERWERMRGNTNPMVTLRAHSGSFKKGHKPVVSEGHRAKLSESKKGSNNPNYGKPETSKRLNVYVVCDCCGATMNKGNYVRWHGDRCKSKL